MLLLLLQLGKLLWGAQLYNHALCKQNNNSTQLNCEAFSNRCVILYIPSHSNCESNQFDFFELFAFGFPILYIYNIINKFNLNRCLGYFDICSMAMLNVLNTSQDIHWSANSIKWGFPRVFLSLINYYDYGQRFFTINERYLIQKCLLITNITNCSSNTSSVSSCACFFPVFLCHFGVGVVCEFNSSWFIIIGVHIVLMIDYQKSLQ